ncbi:MAG: helicase C-terminal domain-containing protein [Candidatus Fermentibacteria bacterium]
MNLTEKIENVFTGDVLTSSISAYVTRPSQVKFAAAVGSAMESGGIFLFEAGTGIGKSLAYIIPAILSGRKIFVSTATITLQDQLAKKDAPAVLSALNSDAMVSVLKGRNNYLCLRKWRSGSPSLKMESDFEKWVESTEDGDISSFSEELPSAVWRHFRSDHLDCTGSSCHFRGACHFFSARVQARKSDILILNHHLLISGLMADEVLPGADVLVIDEAHRLEDAASSCLGLSLSEGMLLPIYDGIAFSDADMEKKAALLAQARILSAAIADLTDGIKETSVWDPVENLEGLEEVLKSAKQLAADTGKTEEMLPVSQTASAVAISAGRFMEISREEYCCFVETGKKHTVLKAVPLDIGPDLMETVYSRFDTTVLTSATLTVADEFDFFRNRLGAWDARVKSFGSPFDYSSQAILSIPDSLPPHDSHEDLAWAVWQWGRRLAEVLDGRTLLLFTSYRNLKLVKRIAEKELPSDIRLFTQGDMSRSGILRDFRECSRAVILGTSSFWEGVDLPGSMLQAVIIDRLPFASPGHPLIKARMDMIEKHGGSSFGHYSLPLAAVRLKQGVGRLIRSLDDMGVVMIMDRRIVTKNYGKVFLRSIPPFRVVSEDQIMDFVMEHCSSSGVSSVRG